MRRTHGSQLLPGGRVICAAEARLAGHGQSAQGFTLVEVLVVLIIVALSVSLVAPSLINAYEGMKGAAEEQRLVSILDAVKMKSFLRQTAYSLHFEENRLTIKENDIITEFDYIIFPVTTIRFNANGFADVKILKYVIRDKEKELNVG